MSDWVVPIVWLIVAGFGMIGGVTVGRLLSQRFMDWRQDRSEYELEKPKPEKLRLFCSDCGKKYILATMQNGYDSETGKPFHHVKLRCPDYKPGKSLGLPTGYGAAMFMAYEDTRNCGATVRKSVGSQHDHSESTSLKCPACISTMFNDGAIDEVTARKLFTEAKVA